jgi:hypothetical protein
MTAIMRAASERLDREFLNLLARPHASRRRLLETLSQATSRSALLLRWVLTDGPFELSVGSENDGCQSAL